MDKVIVKTCRLRCKNPSVIENISFTTSSQNITEVDGLNFITASRWCRESCNLRILKLEVLIRKKKSKKNAIGYKRHLGSTYLTEKHSILLLKNILQAVQILRNLCVRCHTFTGLTTLIKLCGSTHLIK